MADDKDRKVGEVRTAYVTGEAAGEVAHVHLDVPRHLWERFVRWAEEQHLSTSEALLDLIWRHVALPTPEPSDGFYADLTRRHLAGELKRKPGFPDFRLSKDTVSNISREFGTDDPVEWVEKARDRQ